MFFAKFFLVESTTIHSGRAFKGYYSIKDLKEVKINKFLYLFSEDKGKKKRRILRRRLYGWLAGCCFVEEKRTSTTIESTADRSFVWNGS